MRQGFWEVAPVEFECDEKGRFFYQFGDRPFSLEFEPLLFGGFLMGLYEYSDTRGEFVLLLPKIELPALPPLSTAGVYALADWAGRSPLGEYRET
jgi:hypothetical protein